MHDALVIVMLQRDIANGGIQVGPHCSTRPQLPAIAMAPVLFRLGGYDAIRELETTITRGLSWWTDVASAQLGALK